MIVKLQSIKYLFCLVMGTYKVNYTNLFGLKSSIWNNLLKYKNNIYIFVILINFSFQKASSMLNKLNSEFLNKTFSFFYHKVLKY